MIFSNSRSSAATALWDTTSSPSTTLLCLPVMSQRGCPAATTTAPAWGWTNTPPSSQSRQLRPDCPPEVTSELWHPEGGRACRIVQPVSSDVLSPDVSPPETLPAGAALPAGLAPPPGAREQDEVGRRNSVGKAKGKGKKCDSSPAADNDLEVTVATRRLSSAPRVPNPVLSAEDFSVGFG